MVITHGNFAAIRFCCTSGMCIECGAFSAGRKRRLVVQLDGLSEATAKEVAANFAAYDGKAVPMGSPEHVAAKTKSAP